MIFALEIDENEIRAISQDAIEFENYGGPHNIIETAEAITGIGINLGNELKGQNTAEEKQNKLEEYRTIFPGAKYSVIHAVNSENDNLLNADILIFSEAAGVDHIDNIRRILTGFLQAGYGYNYEEAKAAQEQRKKEWSDQQNEIKSQINQIKEQIYEKED